MSTSSKATDVLVQTLIDVFKSIDSAVLVAFTSATFLLIQGLEGKFANAVRDTVAVDIPALGFEGSLYAASLVALVLYCVFCLRAALRARRINALCDVLEERDADLVYALFLSPCLATASRRMKNATCIGLAILGYVAFIQMYLPAELATTASTRAAISELAVSGVFMLAPPLFLAWSLLQVSAPKASGTPEHVLVAASNTTS